MLTSPVEVLGYLARAHGHSHPRSLNPYIAQTLLILLAPILFAASVYMFLGRIVLSTGHTRASLVRSTWLTKIFVGGDVLCFLVQAAGASMLAKTDASKATKDLGKIIVLAGLIIQLFVFGFFVVVAAVFHVRARKIEAKGPLVQAFQWQKYLFMLYAVSGLITVRNVFRVAEYAMGGKSRCFPLPLAITDQNTGNGYLLAHEWPIYVFDTLLMAIAMGICMTWYVGDVVLKFSRDDGEDAYVMMARQDANRGRA